VFAYADSCGDDTIVQPYGKKAEWRFYIGYSSISIYSYFVHRAERETKREGGGKPGKSK